jgi:hypothetical protein
MELRNSLAGRNVLLLRCAPSSRDRSRSNVPSGKCPALRPISSTQAIRKSNRWTFSELFERAEHDVGILQGQVLVT